MNDTINIKTKTMKKFISLAVLAVTLAGSVAFAEVAPVPAPTVKVEAKAPVAPKAKKVAKVKKVVAKKVVAPAPVK